jgi:two-component sensor histidine kinase
VDRIPAIKRTMVANTPLWQGFAWTTLMVAVLTLARWLADRGEIGMQFAPYFPFILLAALLFGWRSGALAAVLSGVAANRVLRDQPLLFYLSWEDAVMIAFFFGTCALLIFIGDKLRRLVRELEEAKIREEVLSGELMHRAKNTLAIVNALASLTRRRAPAEDFFPTFSGRIAALDRATDLLASQGSEQRNVGALVEHAIAPFRSDGNFEIGGPPCEIPQASCIPLMLVLHELCTNAAKHGALTAPEGVVSLAWHLHDDAEAVLRLKWVERGGPPVASGSTPGMGSTLMRAQKGLRSVDLRLPPEGAECDIEVEGARTI